MNGKASTMKKEIHAVAHYRALMLSKYFITLLLGLASLYLGVKQYALSSFYILLVLNALPPILSHIFKDYAKNSNGRYLTGIMEETPFQLKILKRKYNYSKLNYITNTISHLASLLLLFLWQTNYNSSESLNEILRYLPLTILIAGVFLRFFCIAVYLIKLPYDLSHNKL